MIRIEFAYRLEHFANAKGHWRAKANNARKVRRAVAWQLALYHVRPALPCRVTMTRLAPRRYDSDNVIHAFKPGRDEVAAWLGVDDRHDDLVQYIYKQEQTEAGQYFVRIEIESIEQKESA